VTGRPRAWPWRVWKPSWLKEIRPGDLIVMVGGRIGKDGIHGATFSSAGLHEESPTSAVQIGDPFTQKVMADLLIEARDRGLYRAIQDNGNFEKGWHLGNRRGHFAFALSVSLMPSCSSSLSSSFIRRFPSSLILIFASLLS